MAVKVLHLTGKPPWIAPLVVARAVRYIFSSGCRKTSEIVVDQPFVRSLGYEPDYSGMPPGVVFAYGARAVGRRIVTDHNLVTVRTILRQNAFYRPAYAILLIVGYYQYARLWLHRSHYFIAKIVIFYRELKY